MTPIYATAQNLFAYCPQPSSVGGLIRATLPMFACSGDGEVDGTSIVASALGDIWANVDDLVGYVVECIYAERPQNLHKRAMVRAYDGLETLTVDALPAQVGRYDRFLLFETPDAPVVADKDEVVGTQVRDATRAEPDDYWNGLDEIGGFHLMVENAAASENRLYRIADFSSDGTFTLADPLDSNAVTGEMFRLVRMIEARGEMTRDRPDVMREARTGGFGTLVPAAGLRSGSGTIELVRRGPGNGRDGLPAEAHDFLSCTMDYVEGAISTAAGGGGTPDEIPYSVGSHVPGQFLITPTGDLAMITEDDGGSYFVSPAPRIAPLAGQDLGRVCTYTPANQLNLALTIYQWIGAMRAIFRAYYGCVPVLTLSGQANAFTNLAFAIMAADWYEASLDHKADPMSRDFCPRMPTVVPIQSSNLRVNIGGYEFPIQSYQFTPAPDVQPVPNGAAPNWTDGHAVVNAEGSGQIVCVATAETRRALDSWISKEPLPIMIQDGISPGFPGLVGVWIQHAVYTGATPSDDAGKTILTLPFVARRPELCTGLPLAALAIA